MMQDVLFGVVIVMALVNALLAAAMAKFFQMRTEKREVTRVADPEWGGGVETEEALTTEKCTKFVF